MKVLHVLNELKFSGAEIMYVDAAQKFVENGVEQLFVLGTAQNLGEFSENFINAGYEVIHIPYPKCIFSRWLYYEKIIKLVKNNRIDVIHTHKSAMRWGMAYCAWRAGIRSVYTTHSILICKWFTKPWHIWLRWSGNKIFGCKYTSISDSVYNHELNYYHNKTYKIYNWYCDNRFYPATSQEERLQVRNELGIKKDALTIISVGGCNNNKRHSDIFKAFANILKRYPNAVYLHLGQGTSTEEEMILAHKLGVEKQVVFLGNQQDVRHYLIASDIYIMSSKFEGISLTTIEAMACQIPCVLYDVPGLRDFNSLYETSVLIPSDSNLLSESVIKLFEDKNKQDKLTSKAVKYVNDHFLMEKSVKQIIELYRN